MSKNVSTILTIIFQFQWLQMEVSRTNLQIYSSQLNLKADIHTPTVVVFQHKSHRASE